MPRETRGWRLQPAQKRKRCSAAGDARSRVRSGAANGCSRSGELGGLRRVIARANANEAERHHEKDKQQDEDEKWELAPQPGDADHVQNATEQRPTMPRLSSSRIARRASSRF